MKQKKKISLEDVESVEVSKYGKPEIDQVKEEYKMEPEEEMPEEKTVYEEEKPQMAPMPVLKEKLQAGAQGKMEQGKGAAGLIEKKNVYIAPQKPEPWENIVRKLKNKSPGQQMLYQYKDHPDFKRIKKVILGY